MSFTAETFVALMGPAPGFRPDYDRCAHCGIVRCLHPVDPALGWPEQYGLYRACMDFEPLPRL